MKIPNDPDRRAQHRRILQDGPAGPEDYAEVQYLKEKGLAKAEIQPSYMRENYGKPIAVVWLGPTASGRDYQEDLQDELPSGDPQHDLPGGYLDSGHQEPPKATGKLAKASQQASKTTRFVWITVATAVIGGVAYQIVSKVLALHFEFFQ